MNSDRKLLAVSALCGAISVAISAFAAHGAGPQQAQWLATGGHYLLVHSVLGVALALWPQSGALGRAAGWLAVGGGIVFCAALTLLAFTGVRIMGAVAPVGGSLMIIGWLLLAVRAVRGNPS